MNSVAAPRYWARRSRYGALRAFVGRWHNRDAVDGFVEAPSFPWLLRVIAYTVFFLVLTLRLQQTPI